MNLTAHPFRSYSQKHFTIKKKIILNEKYGILDPIMGAFLAVFSSSVISLWSYLYFEKKVPLLIFLLMILYGLIEFTGSVIICLDSFQLKEVIKEVKE